MQIQLNTDSHIAGSEALSAEVKSKTQAALKRFAERITRVEVHLGDLNSSKSGPDDKRCVVEARVAGLNPVSVSHQAPTLSLALDGSLEKMISALGSALGKRDAVRRDTAGTAEDSADA